LKKDNKILDRLCQQLEGRKSMHGIATECDIQGGPIKNMALYLWPYLRHLLTDFQNFFTGTLCRQFAIVLL